MSPSEKIRALLDEREIEWKECEPLGANAITRFCVNGVWLRYVDYGDYCWIDYHEDAPLTPEQAIAATVGNGTDLADRLREVHGLHAFAELFGFSWEDGSDWDWHDVACAMSDAIDAMASVGTCRAVVCNQTDCVNHHDGRCEARRLEIQDQECMTYRCRDIDYDEEEE